MGASRAANDRKVPYELLCAGAFDEAADGYRAIRKSDPSDAAIEESALNQAGYRLLRENKIKEAIILFRLNVDFYPNSWNVYDSLGEAYAASGAKALAIISYKKSLELNPKNTGALEALKSSNSKCRLRRIDNQGESDEVGEPREACAADDRSCSLESG